MRSEDESFFNEMLDRIYEIFEPEDYLQARIVDFISLEILRLYRISMVETEMFDLAMFDGTNLSCPKRSYAEAFIMMEDRLTTYSRYKLSDENALFKKMRELKQLKEKDSLNTAY